MRGSGLSNLRIYQIHMNQRSFRDSELETSKRLTSSPGYVRRASAQVDVAILQLIHHSSDPDPSPPQQTD